MIKWRGFEVYFYFMLVKKCFLGWEKSMNLTHHQLENVLVFLHGCNDREPCTLCRAALHCSVPRKTHSQEKSTSSLAIRLVIHVGGAQSCFGVRIYQLLFFLN